MPEEMRFVMRSALYSLGVGVAYWLLTHESAGTILLVGLGLAAAVVFGGMWLQLRGQGRHIGGSPWSWLLLPASAAESHMTDESGRIPHRTVAPLGVAVGVALAGLGLVFGLPMLAAAVVPLGIGLRAWLRNAMFEYAAVQHDGEKR